MKRLLFLIAFFCSLAVNAQNYLISFAGTGASTTVSTVEVENLTAGTSLTLNGDDILRLTLTTTVNSLEDGQSSRLKIYPNPIIDESKLLISAPTAGDAIISIYDITGRKLTQIKSFVDNSSQEFAISGLGSGLFFINVKGNTYQLSGKLISNGKTNETTSIEKVSSIAVDEKISKNDTKGAIGTFDMEYTTGDRLKFKGISGIYSTIRTDIPTQDKTITFDFVACTDGDNNNYPVVEIGTQVWMVENLRTTNYNDGSTIPLVTDNTTWSNLTTPGYCWYDNDAATYKATYGALYNWYTINTGKLCPTDWHVPTDAQWTILTTFLGGTSVAGGKLKEPGTTHWLSPNTGATNENGFTALPGGWRSSGAFSYIDYLGGWWSSTLNATYAWFRFIYFDNNDVIRGSESRSIGLSVRCIKD